MLAVEEWNRVEDSSHSIKGECRDSNYEAHAGER